MKNFENLQSIYDENLRESVIPFWVAHSPDRVNGGFFSCLDADGKVFDTKKYIWLQGRALWMFCRLYNSYKKAQKYLELAELGLKFIEKYAIDDKGRYYFSLTAEGKPYFYQRKVYGAVFCMLGYLEYFKATGKEQYFDKSVALFWKIRDWVANPALLGRPVCSGLPKTSSLADVMVLASMAIELAAVAAKQEYLDVMADSLKNIEAHFDEKRGILIENAPLDGADISDTPEGRLFSPGHSIEVAWFMLHLLEFLPDRGKEKLALDIIDGSMDFGWDKEYGGLYYFMDTQSRPTLQLEAPMKLWWPHTEAIYALALAFKKTGDNSRLQRLNQVHDYAFEHFVDAKGGEWFGYCDQRGKLALNSKGGNYKGFFHVPRALLFTSQLK